MTFESEEEKAAYFEQCKKMDSNVITPGTEFMALLSSALRYYIHLRMNKDPGWRGVKVNGGGVYRNGLLLFLFLYLFLY